jgi:large subunit ribosomal protein L6
LNENLKEKHFYLAILNKLILGVLKGFYFKLNIIGVGYKAFVEGKTLNLKLGFSHNIIYNIPENITVKVLNQKLLTLMVSGNDFQQVTQVAAQIRALKPAEPYKGKGIKYFNEIIKKKEGKKTNV